MNESRTVCCDPFCLYVWLLFFCLFFCKKKQNKVYRLKEKKIFLTALLVMLHSMNVKKKKIYDFISTLVHWLAMMGCSTMWKYNCSGRLIASLGLLDWISLCCLLWVMLKLSCSGIQIASLGLTRPVWVGEYLGVFHSFPL